MALASGVAFMDIREKLKDPTEAPKRFMMAMADENADGMHFFMTAEEAEAFAIGMLAALCEGHG